MPTVVQFRRGTTSQNNSFTGSAGELSIDTILNTLRVHDGATAGGNELLRKDLSNLVTVVSSIGASPVALDTFLTSAYRGGKYIITVSDVTNGQYQTSEINIVQDGSTATINSFGLVYSGASARMTFTASISTGIVTLYGSGASVNNTVKLVRFLIPV